jgi:hypothetical protein
MKAELLTRTAGLLDATTKQVSRDTLAREERRDNRMISPFLKPLQVIQRNDELTAEHAFVLCQSERIDRHNQVGTDEGSVAHVLGYTRQYEVRRLIL